MIVSKDPVSTFIYSFTFEFDRGIIKFCQDLAKNAGARAFAFKHKKWRFSDMAIIDKIKVAYPAVQFTSDVQVDLLTQRMWQETEVRRMSRALELKNALETDFVVNNTIIPLYPYQRVGVEFLINNRGRCVIADEMGVGKTCQALGYIAHEGIKKTIVICPAAAKGVWKKEAKKFTTLRLYVVTPTPLTEEIWENHDIFCCNYDIISKHFEFFRSHHADCLIADESHRCLPYSTKVLTSQGLIEIGQVVDKKEDMFVLSCNFSSRVVEYKKVISRFKTPAPGKLIRIKHEYGEIECTENHEIWTDHGYVEASKISCGENLLFMQKDFSNSEERTSDGEILQPQLFGQGDKFSTGDKSCSQRQDEEAPHREGVPGLSKDVYVPLKRENQQHRKTFLRLFLCRSLENVFSRETRTSERGYKDRAQKGKGQKAPLGFREDDAAEQRSRVQKKTGSGWQGLVGKESNLFTSWWKWATYKTPGKIVLPAWLSKRVDGISNIDKGCKESIPITTDLLQSRLSSSGEENSDRSGWAIPPNKEMEVSGQKKNGDLRSSRVESVEVLEQGSSGNSGVGSSEDQFVYNIEVEDNHNYFAEGVLVSNCKNPNAVRTRNVGMLSYGIPRFLALSGTPMLNRPIELFTLLHIINPMEWPDFQAYKQRYCWSKEKQNYDGASNIEELRGKISSYFLRRTKDQVLPYLPKRIYSEVPIELDSETATDYEDAEMGLVKDLLSGEKVDTANALKIMNELRRLSSIGKIDEGIDMIKDIIENEKVIIFSNFNEPLKQLKEYFKEKAVEITYKVTTDAARDQAVSDFQNLDHVRIFLGGMRAAGEAITLTAGKTTVFWDRSWVPADHDQAASRNHRPGVVHDSLNVIQLQTPGTIDERMALVLEKKRKTFDELFAKDPRKAQNYMIEAMIESYKKELVDKQKVA